GADDVLGARPRLPQRRQDDLEHPARLGPRIGVARAIGPDRRGAGDEHALPDPHGAAEADLRLEGRAGGDPPALAGHGASSVAATGPRTVREPACGAATARSGAIIPARGHAARSGSTCDLRTFRPSDLRPSTPSGDQARAVL